MTHSGEDGPTCEHGLRAALWHQVAEVLAAELSNWGYGDMHYGYTPRDPGVLAALSVYENAKVQDGGLS